MASKIISIKPLPSGTDIEKIRNILKKYSLERVHVQDGTAYAEFKDLNDIETLDFEFPNLKIDELGGAEIDVVEGQFHWPQSSPASSKTSKENSIDDLSIPNRQNLVVIRNCEVSQSSPFTQTKLKGQLFKNYQSVNRTINKGDYVIVEFLDRGEIQKLENDFPNLKVPQLGPNAEIDAIDQNYDLKLFADQWRTHLTPKKQKTEQKFSQLEQIPSEQKVEGIVQQTDEFVPKTLNSQEDLDKKYLHSEAIPTMEKMTSMEQNFTQRQSSYNETRHKWESGQIQQNNLNNKEHKPVTAIYEDEEINRQSSSKEFIFDTKLKQELDKRKKMEEDEEKSKRDAQQNKTDHHHQRQKKIQEGKKAKQSQRIQAEEQKRKVKQEEQKRKAQEEERIQAQKQLQRNRQQELKRKAQLDRKRTIQEEQQRIRQLEIERENQETQKARLAKQQAQQMKERQERKSFETQQEQTITYPNKQHAGQQKVNYLLRPLERSAIPHWQKYTVLAVLLLWGCYLAFIA